MHFFVIIDWASIASMPSFNVHPHIIISIRLMLAEWTCVPEASFQLDSPVVERITILSAVTLQLLQLLKPNVTSALKLYTNIRNVLIIEVHKHSRRLM